MTTRGGETFHEPVSCSEQVRQWKREFVPFFLNSIREQCNWLIRATMGNETKNSSKAMLTVNQNALVKPHQQFSERCHPLQQSNFKSDKRFERKSSLCDKVNSGKKQVNKRNRKYVQLTTVHQPKKHMPNIADVSEFPPIEKLSLGNNCQIPRNDFRIKNKTRDNTRVSLQSDKLIIVSQMRQRSLVNSKDNFEVPNCVHSRIEMGQGDAPYNDFIMPSYHLVTDKEKLDNLVNMYCKCIESELVPNLSVELYFLFQLFTAKITAANKSTDYCKNSPLNTVHNCVYFTVSVLKKEKDLLDILDHSTLSMMHEIPHLKEFSTDLKQYLCTLCEVKSPLQHNRISSIQGVSFQADTDNRSNFHSDVSFSTFRKQRDLFYELLREWKEYHFSPDWYAKSNFVTRVRHIVNLSSASVNFAHLARLIQSQLLVACDSEDNVDAENNNSEEIAELKRSFPEKVEKLQERFKVPLRLGGPNPLPSFHGVQEFFHDFIESAGSVHLNQHLIDNITAKIIELNQLEISIVDYKIGADMLRERFFCCLCLLRTLAKFLGFLIFLPYQSSDPIPADIVTTQCALRNLYNPPLDILELLSNAVKSNRLILTVPWIAEYLSMMDPVAPCLNYYCNIFTILFKIYKIPESTRINSLNRKFLKIVLGWLFDTPNFPISSFFLYANKEKVENGCLSEVENIDMLDIIDQHIIYSCCPYLRELKIVLEDYLTGIRRNGQEIRKINPMSADNVDLPSIVFQQIEYKLEDNFYHLQSSSVKKTVEFVAARISSKAIQCIRNEIIPLEKADLINKLKIEITELSKSGIETEITEKILSKIAKKSEKVCYDIQNKAIEHAKSFCKSGVEKAMLLLLQDETALEVVQTCCNLSYCMAISKVVSWTKTYVTISYVKSDLKIEVEKLCKGKHVFSDKSEELQIDSSVSVTGLISNLRKMITNLNKNVVIKENDIFELLLHVQIFFISRNPIPFAFKVIESMTVDLLIFLIIYQPCLISDQLLHKFSNLWCNTIQESTEMFNIICPRNVNFLTLSTNPIKSYSLLRVLMLKLLNNGRIKAEELDRSCTIVLQQEWSKDTKIMFCDFLKELIHLYKLSNSEVKFVETMKWLS